MFVGLLLTAGALAISAVLWAFNVSFRATRTDDRQKLNTSIVQTLAAMACLTAATLVLWQPWIGTTSSPQAYLATNVDDTAGCGTLSRIDGSLTFSSGSLADVREIVEIESCPPTS